jgi:pantothenate kinase
MSPQKKADVRVDTPLRTEADENEMSNSLQDSVLSEAVQACLAPLERLITLQPTADTNQHTYKAVRGRLEDDAANLRAISEIVENLPADSDEDAIATRKQLVGLLEQTKKLLIKRECSVKASFGNEIDIPQSVWHCHLHFSTHHANPPSAPWSNRFDNSSLSLPLLRHYTFFHHGQTAY